MAINITTGTATTVATQADAIFIQVNAALTGNFTVVVGGVTQATVTNPTVGSQYRYGGLHGQGAVVITPSTTCDISVTVTKKVV